MTDLFQLNPEMPVIILTAYGTIKGAVEAMKKAPTGISPSLLTMMNFFCKSEIALKRAVCPKKSGG